LRDGFLRANALTVGGLRLAELPRAPRFDLFGFRAYGESKLANVLFSNELARRLAGSGVTSNAIHPGDVATNVARDMWLTRVGINIVRPLRLTPEEGARTTLHVACSSSLDGVTGRYFVDATEVAPSRAARDQAAARALWQLSRELTGAG
jgi:NAD(P)-dependent dehydrogenase (short-subunit alcohol dehydrogenase family)